MAVNTTIQVTMPAMGESVTEGTILEWHKQEGDTIEADEVLVEISTDKVDTELPAPTSGTITEILVEEGATVTVGQVIARMATSTAAPAAAPSAPAAAPAGAGNGGPAAAPPVPEDAKISPVAARVA